MRCSGTPCPQVSWGPRACAAYTARSWRAGETPPGLAAALGRVPPENGVSPLTGHLGHGELLVRWGWREAACWHAGHTGGCVGQRRTWERVVSAFPRTRLPRAPSPDKASTDTGARTTPASLGRPRGLHSSSAPHLPPCPLSPSLAAGLLASPMAWYKGQKVVSTGVLERRRRAYGKWDTLGVTAALHADFLIFCLRTGHTYYKELLARISACLMSSPVTACVNSNNKSHVCNLL